MPAETIVETAGLTKVYGDNTAVNKLNLRIEAGDIFGFLGPNGAGKTTTILMLLGLTEPTSGMARVGGYNSTKEPLQVKRIAGYIPERIGFYEELTAKYNLMYAARLNGLSDRVAEEKIDEALGIVGLSDRAEDKVGTYSRGMKQRLALADILVKMPKVAILDEPTSGIDPKGINEILTLIRTIARENAMTIIISSHQLPQVQKICNRVGIMAKGELVVEGPVDMLMSSSGRGRYKVEVQLQGTTAEQVNFVRQVKGVISVERSGDLLYVTCSEDLRPKIAKAIVDAGGSLVQMKVQSQALEDVYMKYFTGGA
ncbi:MAG: ABC transporter ATP-binding protein [Chloroflexi bacterium]|nr:ABC transporter ATP-binding protein [Chloroflexota bacterium]